MASPRKRRERKAEMNMENTPAATQVSEQETIELTRAEEISETVLKTEEDTASTKKSSTKKKSTKKKTTKKKGLFSTGE